jgi:hypothetical protein
MRNGNGLRAPYRWLGEAASLCNRGWGQVLGGSSLLVAVAVAPSVLQLLLQSALPALASWLQILTTVLGLVLMPPALGGFFRLLQSLDRGKPEGSSQVLSLYSEAPTAQRLILCNLLFAIGTLLVLIGLVYAIGGQPLLQYLQTLAAIKPGATAADLPPLPEGTFTLVGLMLLIALFVTTAQQLAAAQIALGRGEVLRASGEGAMATLGNAARLLLFYLPMLVLGMIGTIVFIVVAGVAATALGLLSKGLAVLAGGIAVLALLVPLYALMLAFFYRAWIALLAPEAGTDPATPPPPSHEIAA